VVFEAGATRGDAEKLKKFINEQKSRRLLAKLIDPHFLLSGKLARLIGVPHVGD